jgi:hypothetical protein
VPADHSVLRVEEEPDRARPIGRRLRSGLFAKRKEFSTPESVRALDALEGTQEGGDDVASADKVHRILSGHPVVASSLLTRGRQYKLAGSRPVGDIGSEDEEVEGSRCPLAKRARPNEDPDAPSLLSTRMHCMFKGIPGLWACIAPDCSEVDHELRGSEESPRPVGKLYSSPILRCGCGSRVLEVFSCRVCGLLYLGGIPDSVGGDLWPWADSLEG